MKILSLALLPFLCSIATLHFGIFADAQGDWMGEGQLAEMELRRKANQSSELDFANRWRSC